jgi:hypothetical protein
MDCGSRSHRLQSWGIGEEPSKLPLQPEEQVRQREAREAFRKRLGLRTLTYADLEWEIAGRRVAGPFCPRCGRMLWGERGTTWARTVWISVENPCKACGREAQHPDLIWSVHWLQNQVLREAQQHGGAGSERGS